ncbi:hypothetical protein SLEP1_g32699 [Rubroshorea leprosula]|uniref:Transmembrane protein n=1 Tax=Rubroshorea leprosula TaxID=152421 RepID=A0AAV5KE56_9ROSI|nr:hypothetical protein SLEP1_g32699 [Rubroshorea leprosula]
MSTAAQIQQPQIQQPQTQQPVVVYPNPVMGQQPRPSSHSNGSFGPVFIVLAVIIAISAISCFLGRLCNRRFSKQKPHKQSHHGQNHADRTIMGSVTKKEILNHNGFRSKERDIEFGFDARMPPAAKPGGNGDLRGPGMPERGDFRCETRPVDHGGVL